MAIKGTGVFLTPEQLADARQRAAAVRATPVMKVAGRWVHEDAAEAFAAWRDIVAIEKGLPAPGLLEGEVNHYGISLEGELTTYEPDGDAS